jgi:hypothetical protein
LFTSVSQRQRTAHESADRQHSERVSAVLLIRRSSVRARLGSLTQFRCDRTELSHTGFLGSCVIFGLRTHRVHVHDLYRSECRVQLTTAYAVDISPMPALSGLDVRLKTEGWHLRGPGGLSPADAATSWISQPGISMATTSRTWPESATPGRRMHPLALSRWPPPLPCRRWNRRSSRDRWGILRQQGRGRLAGSLDEAVIPAPLLLLVGGIAIFAQQPW